MTKYYASYGSNLNKLQMKARCPKATALGAVELPKAQLVFNGVADVVFHETKTAVIGLWKITDACERALDGYEGVIDKVTGKTFTKGAYRKETIRVIVTEDGVEVEADAIIYVMNRDTRQMPILSYLNTIRDGFKDFGLDEKWLREALVDTRAHMKKQDEERAARLAKEDAERKSRPPVPQYRSTHHGITDMFDGPDYHEAQARYYDERSAAEGDDVIWDDVLPAAMQPKPEEVLKRMREEFEEFDEPTYTDPPRRLRTEQDYRRASEALERQNKSKIDRHDKSGYKLPKRKGPHLFDEPSPYHRARK